MVVLGARALAAVPAGDPVEGGRVAELQGDEDLDRDVTGPAAQVTQVHPVVEDPGEGGIRGDPAGDLGGEGTDPGDLADLAPLTSFQPRLITSWLTRTTSSGRRERPGVEAAESIPA